MMAAMMLPSVAPTVALFSRMTKNRSALLPLMFVAGYLLTWAAAGLAAFAVGAGGSAVAGTSLEWNHAGRVLAGVTLSWRLATNSRRSRTCASASVAAHSGCSSGPGATGSWALCGWASRTALGASAAAGP